MRVNDAGLGNAGRLDDHLDAGMGDHRRGVGGDVGAAKLHGVAQRRCRKLLGRPAGGGELASGALDVEIGDRDDVQAARQPRLRQEHGAELAGADQADGHGAARGLAFEQESMQVHPV